MISMVQTGALLNTNLTPQNTASADLVGLSTDTKPTGVSVGNGWSFIEMDTGKVFFYNAEDEEWLEFAGSGGGGGQGGSEMLVIHGDSSTMALDKTWTEIAAANAAVIVLDFGGNAIQRAYVTYTYIEANKYCVEAVASDGVPMGVKFSATSADGYPVYDVNGE